MKLSKWCLLLLLLPSAVFAVEPVNTGLFSNKAVQGYDTVAYFTQNAAVKGSSEFQTEYLGADWLFSSAENLQLFIENPEKYAPQFGGYCAWAVSQNYTASIDPEQFTVHEGKLYLNYNAEINQRWTANKTQFIKDANSHWPNLLDE